MIYRPGQRSMITFASGASTGRGNGSTRPYAKSCGSASDGKPNPVPRLSIARPSKRQKKGATWIRRGQENQGAQTTPARRYAGVGIEGAGLLSRSPRPY